MQMAHDHTLDIFNIISGFLDCRIELLILHKVCPSKYVVELRAPHFRVVLSGTCLEEKKAFRRMRYQNRNHHHETSIMLWVRVADGRHISLMWTIGIKTLSFPLI